MKPNRFGMGIAQRDLLECMADRPTWTLAELADWSGRAASQVTTAMARLVDRGLVEKAGTRPRDNRTGGRNTVNLWKIT